MILSQLKLNFYHKNFNHKTRLLEKFGVKKTTLVAWVGVHPLFLAYYGIDSACAPSPKAHQSSFYLQNPTSILLFCCSLILNVEIQVWGGSDFDAF